MKAALPFLLVWMLCACNSAKQETPLEVPVLSFSQAFNQGKVTTSEQYFYGILSEIIEIDLLHREVEVLDDKDGDRNQIDRRIDSCELRIQRTSETLAQYSNKEWSQQSDFQSLTEKWLDRMTVVIEKLRPMSDAFSRSDTSWSQKEYDLYESYSIAVDSLTLIDRQWVDYQYNYAEANGFELDTTSIVDITELAEKDLLNSNK
jgi:hypothetical protein